ncbi:MAG: hypothetical protein MUO73_01690 [Thermoplasmata archaeon]|nr:hypothetical protein [Thermoplasmata archaeon]
MFHLNSEYVYADYMQYWDPVHVMEKEMPREIARTNVINRVQVRRGLSLV